MKFNKNNLLLLLSVGCFVFSGCNKQEKVDDVHIHNFTNQTINWVWNKTSSGYEVEADITCSTCNEKIKKTASLRKETVKEATCQSEGSKKYEARVEFGGKQYTDSKTLITPITGHHISETYTFDEEFHYKKCLDCSLTLLKESHEFSNYIRDFDPELGLYGSEHRSCLKCGYRETRLIDPLMPSLDEVRNLINNIPDLDTINVYNFSVIDAALELYSYLNEDKKIELGSAYVNKIEAAKEIADNFGVAVKVNEDLSNKTTSNLNNATFTMTDQFKANYGEVLKLEGTKEGWTEFEINPVIPKDAVEVKFSVYVNQPTDMSLSMESYVSKTYSFKNKAFTNLNAGENKVTLAVNTWNEFTVPASDFEKAHYFALYCTGPGTAYGVSAGKPGYVTNFGIVKKGYYMLSPDKLCQLIDTLPAVASMSAFNHTTIDEISKNLSMYSQEEIALVTNLAKFNEFKTAWENKYYVVYDPNMNGIPSGIGATTGSTTSMSIEKDNTYGTVLDVNMSFSSTSTYFQTWIFGMNQYNYSPNDKLIFAIKSPFENVANVSQTAWLGNDETAIKKTLNPNGWTELKGKPSEFNSADISSDFKVILQRYHLSGVLTSYEGTYKLSCIIAERGN